MTPLPLDITLAARRRAKELRDEAFATAWQAIKMLLFRPFGQPAPKELPCRS